MKAQLSPLVADFFGEAGERGESEGGGVGENAAAGEEAEDLVLVAFDEFEGSQGRAVDLGDEVGVEAAVVGGEGPGLEEVVFAGGGLGDVEGDTVEFVGDAVNEDHVFAGLGGDRKSVV